MENKQIYRLIKPYQSNTVYEARTIMHGAGKCYKELKKNNVSSNTFSIMNINDNNVYNFNINKQPEIEMLLKKEDTVMSGGGIIELKTQIKHLEDRLDILEKKLL